MTEAEQQQLEFFLTAAFPQEKRITFEELSTRYLLPVYCRTQETDVKTKKIMEGTTVVTVPTVQMLTEHIDLAPLLLCCDWLNEFAPEYDEETDRTRIALQFIQFCKEGKYRDKPNFWREIQLSLALDLRRHVLLPLTSYGIYHNWSESSFVIWNQWLPLYLGDSGLLLQIPGDHVIVPNWWKQFKNKDDIGIMQRIMKDWELEDSI